MTSLEPRPLQRDADRTRPRRQAVALVAGLTAFQGLALWWGGGWVDALPPDEHPAVAAASPEVAPARLEPAAEPVPRRAADPRDQAPPWSFDADGHAQLRP
ncbi:hypothetical protein [Rubrivivax gelatinosus]|uniref:Uncharacterized protein n=1 Tax=Rubrivivax gelatinosus TaxID=28068 RepID=A0A4R2MCS3_RUBGE|nr:hypothetical protein [Rubrivivax gelatinosus]MBK1687563.1 hypothetical protein [Rubrivivax gelatinosus]TCP02935.1 hypothetical protein EV684_105101 [Rubrivivax gelatinosus]